MARSSTSSRWVPPASPSATSAAPCAACFATAANPSSTRVGANGSSRRRIAALTASTRASRPDNRNSAGPGPGTDSASATAVFTVLSINASYATRSRAVPGCASCSTGSVPSSQPATVATPPRNSMSFDTLPARKATSPSSAPGARSPRAPAEPPAPSTIRPPATATAAVKAPPSSSRTKDVAESGHPKRRAWSTTASATAHTLSAVPMSTRFTLRCAGTVGRWSTPGVSTTGSGERASTRSSAESPAMPPVSPGGASRASRRSPSVASRARVSGRPYPEGPATRSSGPASSSSLTNRAGSASASLVGMERSRNSRPSSSPHRSMLTVPGSIPMTRGIGSRLRRHQLPRDVGDGLGVQHEVVALEQARNARLVHLHLEVSDRECAEAHHAFLRHAVVHHIDPLDAERRNGIHVRDDLEPRPARPRLLRDEHHPRGSGVEDQLRALAGADRFRCIGHGDGAHRPAEALEHELTRSLAGISLARGDAHVRPGLGEQSGGPNPDGPRPRDDQDTLAAHSAHGFHHLRHRGDRRGVRPVRVEHRRHREGLEHRLRRRGEQLLAHRDVRAADEDRGVLQVLGTAREDAAVDQVADIGLDDAAVVGHDPVEHARQPGAVELQQQLTHQDSCSTMKPCKVRKAVEGRQPRPSTWHSGDCPRDQPLSAPPANGCDAVFAWEITWSTFGCPLRARSIDSFTAR